MAAEEPRTHPHLIVLSGEHRGDVIVLDDGLPVVFGTRSGIALPEDALDEVHCQVLQADGRWFLQDFGSASGTWLGDDRVEGLRPIEFGRSFRIGKTHIALLLPESTDQKQVVLEDEAGEAPAAPGETQAEPERDPGEVTDIFHMETPPPGAMIESSGDLKVHDTLGDYDIIELIGEGSIGKVYKGYDRRRRRVVSIKVLDPELARDQHAVARFLRGAKAGGRLSHPHIVRVLAAGHAAGRIYVTMEYVEGLNLEQFCKASGGKLLPRVALGILNRIADALIYAHSSKIVHRNVTPRNILVGAGGFPKLSDLALAKRFTSKKESPMTITTDGKPVAQSPYMAPEGLIGGEMDERSDVWGLGATLFRTLCDVPPYGSDLKKLTQRIMRHEIEDAAAKSKRISPELKALLERALHPDPTQRFQKMRDVRDAISELPELG